jgi:NAD(P)-dependent dehydrogenase (short-subunit alcohol dehydrogenase family)
VDRGDSTLQGRVAVVTGAGGGLGLEIGCSLKAARAEVVASDLDAETGKAAADELSGDFVETDVTDPGSVRALVREVLDGHGRLDVMVNNAGIARSVPAEEMTDEDWRRMTAVNLDGVF